jgi:hypothetical protein
MSGSGISLKEWQARRDRELCEGLQSVADAGGLDGFAREVLAEVKTCTSAACRREAQRGKYSIEEFSIYAEWIVRVSLERIVKRRLAGDVRGIVTRAIGELVLARSGTGGYRPLVDEAVNEVSLRIGNVAALVTRRVSELDVATFHGAADEEDSLL